MTNPNITYVLASSQSHRLRTRVSIRRQPRFCETFKNGLFIEISTLGLGPRSVNRPYSNLVFDYCQTVATSLHSSIQSNRTNPTPGMRSWKSARPLTRISEHSRFQR